MDSVGEGGKIWENGIETCKTSCMKKKRENLNNEYFHLNSNKVPSMDAYIQYTMTVYLTVYCRVFKMFYFLLKALYNMYIYT